MSWSGEAPTGLTPITGVGSAGAVVIGGAWEDDPFAVAEQAAREERHTTAHLQDESGQPAP
ncbi:hypothetical protein ACFWIW_10705 [Amycolatopsis sp. NPDC058340]|uniref:hypothetical protein n=1 Tax=Amycolatopsis sp. NPDC058340 TaxID=3346453 RepID=UPI0036530842